jgi:hypothetical protein
MIINSGQWSVAVLSKIKVKIKIFTPGYTEVHGVKPLQFSAEHGDYVIGGDYAD